MSCVMCNVNVGIVPGVGDSLIPNSDSGSQSHHGELVTFGGRAWIWL
jgi:hypothetical protein